MNRRTCRVGWWIGGSRRDASCCSFVGRFLELVAGDFGGQIIAGLWTSKILNGFELRSHLDEKMRDLEALKLDA